MCCDVQPTDKLRDYLRQEADLGKKIMADQRKIQQTGLQNLPKRRRRLLNKQQQLKILKQKISELQMQTP
jgi:hypothetical protein